MFYGGLLFLKHPVDISIITVCRASIISAECSWHCTVPWKYLPLRPLGHVWDDVGLRETDVNRTVSVLQYCVLLRWCSLKQQIWLRTTLCGGCCWYIWQYAILELHVRNDDYSGTRLVDWIGFDPASFSSLLPSTFISLVFMVLYTRTLCSKKHVTTFLVISWTRTVRLQRFLAYLLLRL